MSTDLERQLREDRSRRDEALASVKADIDGLKADYAEKSIKERATDKLMTRATSIREEAVEVASEHRGPLIALLAALVLWFARHPIMSLFGVRHDDEDADEHYDDERDARAA